MSVEGIRNGFQAFMQTMPSPEVLDLFALDVASLFVHLTIAGYTSLVERASLLDERKCPQGLRANLARKQEALGRLERLGHEMSQSLLASAGGD
jgi:ferritin-like metal-binding protein YciE